MERADDGHAGSRGGDGVVMAQLAGEEKLRLGVDRVIDHLAAGPGAAGGARYRPALRSGDEQVAKLQFLLDAIEQFAALDLRECADSALPPFLRR